MDFTDPDHIRMLRILRAIQDYGTFEAAGGSMSPPHGQPFVSREMTKFERLLQFPLFENTRSKSNRSVLTDEAKTLLQTTVSLDTLLQDAGQVVDKLRRGTYGAVSIAASTTAGTYLLPHALGELHERFPDIHPDLYFVNRHNAQRHLLNGQVDLVIIQGITPSPRIETQPFARNEHIVAACSSHPLANHHGISLDRLSQEYFVLREKGSGTRIDTEQLFHAHDLPLHIRLRLPGNGAIKRAVQANLGIAILSRYAAQPELDPRLGTLIELDVQGFPLKYDWLVARPTGNDTYRSSQAQTLWQFMLDYRDKHKLLETLQIT
jgi:LysR family transcriptional regulator, low CO2-responsive transcriptional regulator